MYCYILYVQIHIWNSLGHFGTLMCQLSRFFPFWFQSTQYLTFFSVAEWRWCQQLYSIPGLILTVHQNTSSGRSSALPQCEKQKNCGMLRMATSVQRPWKTRRNTQTCKAERGFNQGRYSQSVGLLVWFPNELLRFLTVWRATGI